VTKAKRRKAKPASKSAGPVGREVSLSGAYEGLRGQVIEDRGRIGPAGEHVYRVSVTTTASEPMVFEAAASMVHVIEATLSPSAVARRKGTKTRTTKGRRKGRRAAAR
jgi:hypothetical protein